MENQRLPSEVSLFCFGLVAKHFAVQCSTVLWGQLGQSSSTVIVQYWYPAEISRSELFVCRRRQKAEDKEKIQVDATFSSTFDVV